MNKKYDSERGRHKMCTNDVSSCSAKKEKINVELTKDFEEIKDAVLKAVVEGKISCGAARKVAEVLGIKPAEVGYVVDQIKVKVFGCELGCF